VFCIDLNLAAQGDSLDETRSKLKGMIKDYLIDALSGEDQEYADQLLQRKAPFEIIFKYHYYQILTKIGMLSDSLYRLFKTPVPWVPKNYVYE
jgi:hypothetical protein